MKTFSLYVPRDSLIHRINPIDKILYTITAIAVPLILPSMAASFLCMLISLSLLAAARVVRQSLPVFAFVFLILCTVVLIQGWFYPGNQTPLFGVEPFVFHAEGLMKACRIGIRVTNVVAAFLLLVLTTKPADLVEELVRRGLSPRIGYVLDSIFQILPQMMNTTRTILDAQRSRGLETEGNLWVRVKAFLPLIGPVVMSSLIHAKERALALEVRGLHFEGQRTWLREKRSYPYSREIRGGLLLVLTASIVWRILG
ncbi:MAG: energy-coupling factor transporter transmembrane component T family protein [Planifilum sp.]|jgi:energy-coupling factor transport system permease protein